MFFEHTILLNEFPTQVKGDRYEISKELQRSKIILTICRWIWIYLVIVLIEGEISGKPLKTIIKEEKK